MKVSALTMILFTVSGINRTNRLFRDILQIWSLSLIEMARKKLGAVEQMPLC